MDIKKIVIPIIGVGVLITGILLKNNLRAASDVAKVAFKEAKEPVETFGGVSLSKLNELAKGIYRGISCTVDEWGFLVFHSKSNRGHQTFHTQMMIDGANKLKNLGGHYPGQWWSSADEFAKKANELFAFKK